MTTNHSDICLIHRMVLGEIVEGDNGEEDIMKWSFKEDIANRRDQLLF